jgi:tetratricopeptide (TPR) repeat protein
VNHARMFSLLFAAAAVIFTHAQDSRPAELDEARRAEIRALAAKGYEAYEAKRFDHAIELFQAALDKGARSPDTAYNLACCHALVKRPDDAFKALTQAIERGWRDVDHMKADADLVSLHADPRWAEALKACEAATEKHYAALKEPKLARELNQRMQEDQIARRKIEPLMKNGQGMAMEPKLVREIERIDTENTAWLKDVVDKHGWPGKSLVGEQSAQAAWLLVQHADRDPAFQRRCLDLIVAAHKKGETTGQQVAYLTDRVLLKEGKKQLYGTQFSTINGELKPQPIEDEANVDVRRKEMGLGTLADYAKSMRGG